MLPPNIGIHQFSQEQSTMLKAKGLTIVVFAKYETKEGSDL